MFSRSGSPFRKAAVVVAALFPLTACTLAGPPAGAPAPDPAPRESPPGGEAPARSTAEAEVYEVDGRRYTVLASAEGYREVGLASWYGDEFRGRPTANGEPFDPDLPSAAHRTLPLGTWVEVTSLETGRRVRVRVNDRGPFRHPEERIIDLSRAAARRLGALGAGTVRVEVRALPGDERPDPPGGR